MNNSSSFLSTKPWLPLNTLLHKLHKHGQTCFVRCSRRGNLDNHYADSPDNDIVVMFWNLGVSRLTLIPAWTSNHVPSKVCDEIIHPFSSFKGPAVEVWESISNFTNILYMMDIITYPCCDKQCHSDNSQMYSLIWLLLQQESIWSHSADILSARQYLNQPKDDAIIFSWPPRWNLADVDHKTQNTIFQIPCFVSSGRRMSSVWASLFLWFCNIYMVRIHSV